MKILFVMSGDHPFHRKLAEIIGADIYVLGSPKNPSFYLKFLKLPLDYDVYITESNFYTVAFLKSLGLIKGKLVNLLGSPILYWYYKNRLPIFSKKILEFSRKYVDGELLIGSYWKNLHHDFFGDVPYFVVPPFLMNTFYDLSPNLKSYNICIVANIDWYYKGIDLLIDAYKRVREIYADSNLYIIGNISFSNHIPDGVHFVGRVPDLGEYFSKCSLYVHPARGEVYGLSIVEAMSAGLPTLVSNETGAASDIQKISPDFVVPLSSEDLAKAIINYFRLNPKTKSELSERFRSLSKSFVYCESKLKLLSAQLTRFLEAL